MCCFNDIMLSSIHELLFRHIFETQTRKKFILGLATNDFFQIVIKVSQRAVNNQIMGVKASLQKSSFGR